MVLEVILLGSQSSVSMPFFTYNNSCLRVKCLVSHSHIQGCDLEVGQIVYPKISKLMYKGHKGHKGHVIRLMIRLKGHVSQYSLESLCRPYYAFCKMYFGEQYG